MMEFKEQLTYIFKEVMFNIKALKQSLLEILVRRFLKFNLLELYYDKKISSDFMSIARELEPIGQLTQDKSYKFKFKDFDK